MLFDNNNFICEHLNNMENENVQSKPTVSVLNQTQSPLKIVSNQVHKKPHKILFKLILGFLSIIILSVFAFMFVVYPMQIKGNSILSLPNNSYVLSEKISYILHSPSIGDVVTFSIISENGFSEMSYVGLIVSINGYDYRIISSGSKPWVVKKNMITHKIYYPHIDQLKINSLVNTYTLIANETLTPIPSPNQNSNWDTYISKKYKFTFRYPSEWKVKDRPISDSPTSKFENGTYPLSTEITSPLLNGKVTYISINPEGGSDLNINPEMKYVETILGNIKARLYAFPNDTGFWYYNLIDRSNYPDFSVTVTYTLSNKDITSQILSTFRFIQ
jgi:hypothetical protein